MFGTMGITELILILAIVLIVFGAGKLPKIGEGLGKALKGFKKEVREAEPIPQAPEQAQAVDAQVVGIAPATGAAPTAPAQPAATAAPAAPAGPPPVPPQMGPAATPGTTAYMVAQQSWKPVTPPPVAPPPAPATAGNPVAAAAPAQPAGFKAEVNKPAVQRVMAQQAAMKAKQQQPQNAPPTMDRQALEAAGMQPPPADPGSKPMVKVPDLQNLGSGIGDALRTFREAANDVKRAVDPSMHQIKAEMEAAQKEIQGSIDYVKESPKVEEPPK
ncbi:MAG: twin-arginine translocase TatA/TatE family subunit [Nitrospirae bacterium]|nr:MAG: twin-arginine translocase TatA/TatE family subunit [Nitrospirota bacterium]